MKWVAQITVRVQAGKYVEAVALIHAQFEGDWWFDIKRTRNFQLGRIKVRRTR